nr:GspH/FimT family pseudopilin [Seongchinamella unica]
MELMIVLVILGVILGVALPGFRNLTLATRLTNYVNEFVAGIYTARGEAIKRNTNVRLCASADWLTCATSGGWAQGWIVTDPNNVVIREYPGLETGFSMTESGGAHTLTFDSTGYAGVSTTFNLCRHTPSLGYQGRQVSISITGRSNVTRTTPSSCP